MPREELDRIELLDELVRFLYQSNISAKNISRLEILKRDSNKEIRELAGLILEVALAKPYKRRRWKFLAQHYPDLWQRLRMALVDDFFYELSDPSARMDPRELLDCPQEGTVTDLDEEIPF